MCNLRSESEVLDLEKGKGSDPKTASALASAAENEDTELVTDPRKARLINFAVAVFCVAAIVVFVYSVYSMCNGTVSFWEAFGYCAVLVICAVSVGTVLMVRKALISKFAAARPIVAPATTTAARRPAAANTTAACRPPAATTNGARLAAASTTARPRPAATTAARPARAARRDDDDVEDPLDVLFGLL